MAALNDDDIVISGISGVFPESNNIEELWENLINHVNMVTVDDRRWNTDFFIRNHHIGKIKDLREYDTEYFQKKSYLAQHYRTIWKISSERIVEAIIDSGRSLANISNTKTSVYAGSSNAAEPDFRDYQNANDLSKAFNTIQSIGPNGLSYFLNVKGESLVIDTACSTGLTALKCAMDSLRKGRSDYAIVCCSSMVFFPTNFLALEGMGMLSSKGKCSVFDEAADGYIRSDSFVAIFLEKAKTAKRVYCNVLNCQTNYNGYSNLAITSPVPEMQEAIYKETLSNVKKINHLDVTYIEAHGTGTIHGDTAEIESVSKVYCKDRKEPLLIGSIKSNLGHGELAAGLTSLIKSILIMERRIIPANLHFNKPNPKIPGLHTGQIKVVSENTPWKGGLIAVNSFGGGGSNSHAILCPNQKEKSLTPDDKTHRLFAVSSRTKEGVEILIDTLEKNPDPNFCALLSGAMEDPDPDYPWKGYTILNSEEHVRKIEMIENEQRPVCFVFSGFGCQWIGMGKDLMEMEFFRVSVRKSIECLKDIDIDVDYLMANQDKLAVSSMSWQGLCLVTAIQIAFTDMLRMLEITPDYIIGYSTGETACGYADGCITREQAMLLSYHKALGIVTKNPRNGMMAVAGISTEDASKDLPPGVTIACHNSSDSVTLAGEADAMTKYLTQLRLNNIGVKKFDSYGFAFHCKTMDQASESLLTEFSKIIPNPKPRSSKWISTSIPEKDWDSDLAKTFSAEYLVHNFLEPVLFYEGLQHIPKNSIFIEISPHNILTPLLKREFGTGAKYLTFMKKNAANMNVMLTNIGEMYLSGLKPKISRLYPAVDYPVPRGTPMISPLLRWNHSKPERVLTMKDVIDSGIGSVFLVQPFKGTFGYVCEHQINGQMFFPAAAYLFLAWHQFSMHRFTRFDKVPIVLENVRFLRSIILTKSETERLKTRYLKETQQFEIYHNDEVCAVGFARSPKLNAECTDVDLTNIEVSQQMFSTEDIYKEFRLKGYEYGKQFQGLSTLTVDGTVGKIKWKNNWITFIESMMQLQTLNYISEDPSLITEIDYIYIDPSKHKECAENCDSEDMEVKFQPYERKIQAGGIICRGVSGTKISKVEQREKVILEEYKFIPYFDDRSFAYTPLLSDDLQQYSKICEKYIGHIILKAKNCPDDAKKKYSLEAISEKDSTNSTVHGFLNNSKIKPYLLQHLIGSVESTQGTDMDLPVCALNNEEEGDVLVSAFLNDEILKATVDVAMENITSSTVNIIQISTLNVWLTKHLSLLFQTYPDRKANYTITKTESVELENEALTKMAVDCIEWDVASASLKSTLADIIISYHTLFKNKSKLEVTLSNIKDALNDGGFALMIEPIEDSMIGYFLNSKSGTYAQHKQRELMESFKASHLQIVAQKSDGVLHDIYLLRKVSETTTHAIPIEMEDDNFEQWVPKIQKSLHNLQETNEEGNIWLISRNSPYSGIIGLAKSLAKEPYGNRIRCLFETQKDENDTGTKNGIPEDIIRKDLLININQNGKWGSLRNIKINADFKMPLPNAVLNIKNPGDFGSLYWCELDLEEQLLSKKTLEAFYVYYAGLSYFDIVKAKKQHNVLNFNEKPQFGYDFSGRKEDNTRIMGITYSTIATAVTCEPKFTWTVPQNWTLAEAATVPLAYTLAYFALSVKANLQVEEKVLINCASDAVGQAAVNIALSMSCVVYVTVDSEDKRIFMKNEYPAIQDQNIFNSSDLRFEAEIMKATKGKGVDVVMNSLTKEQLLASLRCLAGNGRFINFGDRSLPSKPDLDILLENKDYFDINFEALFTNTYYFQEVERKFSYGLKNGVVKPIKKVIFQKEDIENAFLFLQNEINVGKILIEIRKEEATKEKPQPKTLLMPVDPIIHFSSNSTVIVVGAFGGVGMELIRWLGNRGARNLVLNSRKGIKNGYQERCVSICKKSGINVLISNDNLLDENSTLSLIRKANKIGPVIGIFNLAMVLEDDLMPNQSPEKFRRVTEVKIQLTRNLDNVSRRYCPYLKYFIGFSSMAARGSPSQSNYAYGNAALERICAMRRDAGLPGLAIQWGLIGDVGYVHEKFGDDCDLGDLVPQKISSCLAALDILLNQQTAVVASYCLAKAKKTEIFNINFLDYLSEHFGVDCSTLDKNQTIVTLGLDSMKALELKTDMEENWNLTFSFHDLPSLTIAGVEELIKHNLKK